MPIMAFRFSCRKSYFLAADTVRDEMFFDEKAIR